jgi:hypothetical protein
VAKWQVKRLDLERIVRMSIKLVLAFVLVHSHASIAGSLMLTWDASPGPGTPSYSVYYGTVRGHYSNRISTGPLRKVRISGLREGATYFFVVTARDALGLESPPSNEVSFTVPGVFLTIERPEDGAPPGTFQVASAGPVPFAWALEASEDLKVWRTIMSGANSVVNVAVATSSLPRLFFRIKNATMPPPPRVVLVIRRNQPGEPEGIIHIASAAPVPFAWVLEGTEDFHTWRTLMTGAPSSIDVAVSVPGGRGMFFRLRSH